MFQSNGIINLYLVKRPREVPLDLLHLFCWVYSVHLVHEEGVL